MRMLQTCIPGNHEQESNAATSGQNAYTSKVVYIPPHGQAGMRVASASNRRLAKVCCCLSVLHGGGVYYMGEGLCLRNLN